MGLDMFLTVRKKSNPVWNWEDEEDIYWRKANQIRKWFVENLEYEQDPKSDSLENVRVPKEKLEELLDTVTTVLNNPYLADELLPTEAGFFFGSCNYDSWYFNQLESTKRQLEEILSTTNFETEDVYYDESW